MSSMGKALLYFLNVNLVDEGKPCGEIGSRRSWYHPNWGWYKCITCQPWCAGPHWKGTWYTISLLTWTTAGGLVSSWPWGILLFRSRTQGSGLGDFGSTQMFRVLGLPCVCTWSSDWLIHFVDTGDSFSHKRLFMQASPTLAAAYSISKAVRIPVMCASGISAVTAPMARAAGAAGVVWTVSLSCSFLCVSLWNCYTNLLCPIPLWPLTIILMYSFNVGRVLDQLSTN